MKIATFNINGVNKRLANLLDWLEREAPDVACLQELKCEQRDFPDGPLRALGYSSVWVGQRAWNGVAILARGHRPIVTLTDLPGAPEDRQARYIEAAVNGVIVASIYLPNGNPQPGPKFDYKLAWFERLAARATELLENKIPVVLAGDFNVAPTDLDIYPTRSWDDDALIQLTCESAWHLTSNKLPTMIPVEDGQVIAIAERLLDWVGSALGADMGSSWCRFTPVPFETGLFRCPGRLAKADQAVADSSLGSLTRL